MDTNRNEESTQLPGIDDLCSGESIDMPATQPSAATAKQPPLPDWIAGFARLSLRS